MVMTATPQHLVALDRANAVRFARARLKDEIRVMRAPQAVAMLCDILSRPPEPMLAGMPLGELLLAIHGVGDTRLRAMFFMTGAPSLTRKLSEITERQRIIVREVLVKRIGC